jgi:TolB-like protein
VEPSAPDVQAALDRILASPPFAGGGRAGSLLRYLVERTLDGRGDTLKEYVLGVELFHRGDGFDPKVDTIVRVEARRLRAKLDEYYGGPGASDPVRIDIPRGAYVPTFHVNGHDAAPAPPSDPAEHTRPASLMSVTTTNRGTRSWLAAVLLAVVGLAAWQLVPRTLQSSAESAGIRLAVLPLAHFSTDPEAAMIAARITDGVTSELARVPELSVVSRTTAARFASEAQPIRDAARALDAALVMEGSVVIEAGGIHAVMRIVDAALDRKVWVGEYDSPPDQIASLQRRIASEVSTAIRARYSAP